MNFVYEFLSMLISNVIFVKTDSRLLYSKSDVNNLESNRVVDSFFEAFVFVQEASAIPFAALTAWRALKSTARITDGYAQFHSFELCRSKCQFYNVFLAR